MLFRNRLLLVIISISLTAIVSIYIMVNLSFRKTAEKIANDNTRNLLDIAMLTIETNHRGLNYHREYATNLRKNERIHIVNFAKSIIEDLYRDYQDGKISEAEAKRQAIKFINNYRYDNGNGYIWINNTELPIPRIIVHPIYPEYNNKLSTAPLFYTTADSSSITVMAVDICLKQGSGFIEYFWAKPSDTVEAEINRKVSYVSYFEPWQWILGTGVYLEDIEEDSEQRKAAMLKDLDNTMGRIHIAESGYFFIFKSDKELLLHPYLKTDDPDSNIYYSSFQLMEKIMQAERSPDKTYEYTWINPAIPEDKTKHKKKVYIEYFEPLDWYVCASIYEDEINKPATLLRRKVLYFALIFIILTTIVSLIMSESLARPMRNLMKYVSDFPKHQEQIETSQIPVSGSKELRALSHSIRDMLIAIQEQKDSLIDAKLKIKESEERYRFLVENSPTVFWILDENSQIRYVSPNIPEVFGLSAELLMERGLALWAERVHAEDFESLRNSFRALRDKQIPMDNIFRFISDQEKTIWLHFKGEKKSSIFGEGTAYGVGTDITELRLAEQRILKSMIQAEENERSRIAKDLHDGVSPLLSAIKLFTQSMSDSRNTKLKAELSEKISITIGEAIQTINEISANISPHILQNFGLTKAVESFANRVSISKGISYMINSKIKDRLPIEIETALYRISVELINNTIKYASAKNIDIEFKKEGLLIRMGYKDDGIGFNPDEKSKDGEGMGLFNMRNRVESLSGNFKITSNPKKGTKVSISIPIETEA